jgi:hypothetical protein
MSQPMQLHPNQTPVVEVPMSPLSQVCMQVDNAYRRDSHNDEFSASVVPHDLEGYAIAATKNQVFEAILIMMLRSLQAISRAFFMINLPSRVNKRNERQPQRRNRLNINGGRLTVKTEPSLVRLLTPAQKRGSRCLRE